MPKKPSGNELIAYVDGLYDRAQQSRWMYLAQWMLNFHFFVGNQWIEWIDHKLSWESLPNLEGETRLVQNKILPATRMLIGRMLKDQQIQQVIQAHNDEKAIDSAKAATKFLEYTYRRTCGDAIKKEVCTWAAITGIGITKTYIDPDGGPTHKTSKKPDGEICVDVLSPFEFIVPPTARKMERLPWAMHARIETVDWVYENYGVEVTPTGDMNNWAIYQANIQNITTEGTYFGSNVQFQTDTVLAKELWIRPCRKWPNGRVIITAGNTVLHDEDIPFDKDYWPFNWMNFFDIPFRFWPMGIVEPMIDTQKSINEMASDILENIKYMGKPIILLPMGSMEPDSCVAEAGAQWEYNSSISMGQKPELVTPTPVSPEIFNEKSLLEQHIFDTAGIHMAGGGMGGIRAAAAVMLLEQQDDTEFGPVKVNIESFLRRDAEIKLFLAQKSFSTPRKVKVLGEEGQWEVAEFNASDLTGDEEIEITAKQEFANDKMTRFNQVTQLAQLRDENGQPYIDRTTVLRLLDIADMGGAMTDFDLDYNRAKNENSEMLKGKPVAVNDFDDHATHIRIHNQERKRIDFDKLDKKVRDLFTQHVLDHQSMMQNETGQQQVAKGDDQMTATRGAPQANPGMMPGGMGPMPQLPSVGGFNGQTALNRGVDMTHNMLGRVGL